MHKGLVGVLGPTPPTNKSMMWIGSRIVPLMAYDIAIDVA
uniref:Uncharacterized protein n=1 Tax=Musa acuminata subsp. malaccensis TaxID=214687 RepID=A0A804KVD4_MUSAM